MINFEKAVRNINRSLNKKQPERFSSQWIKNRCKISYQFILENIKTEFDEPDWDLIVSKLERHNQRLWMRKMKKDTINLYKDREELNVILNCHKNKFYTFLGQVDREDRIICDWISIKLVRLSQKGNLLAKKKVIGLLENLVDQWIEFDKSLSSWKGHNDFKNEHIDACIRRFRYAGSFLGYLHRTLQYAGLGLVPIEKFSLDDYYLDGKNRLIDKFILNKNEVRKK